MPNAPVLTPCPDCGVMTRSTRASARRNPGTRARRGRLGQCDTCFRRNPPGPPEPDAPPQPRQARPARAARTPEQIRAEQLYRLDLQDLRDRRARRDWMAAATAGNQDAVALLAYFAARAPARAAARARLIRELEEDS